MAGIIFSLVSLPLHLLLTPQQSIEIASMVVAVIGAIYVAFALQKGSFSQIVIEVLVASLFFGAALAGLWWNPWIIPAAYVAHGFWDALHHFKRHSLVEIPTWYPAFCAAYDWLYAAGLAAVWFFVVGV